MSTGGLSSVRLARMREVLAGYVERGEMPGLVSLVYRKGEVHVDAIGLKAFGTNDPMRRDTLFRIASMTKPITAVAALILVEECKLRLDEPVDRFLPELADRRVLGWRTADLDTTVSAERPITLRDLLTFRLGIGAVMAPPGLIPIQRAMAAAGVAPGPNPPSLSPDEFMRRLGALPLIHQPGEGWLYHTGSDVLSVLIARATGQPFETFLRERIFEPLGMRDTFFNVPPEKQERLAPSYESDPATGAPRPAAEPSEALVPFGGSGLVSTVDDYLAFCQMLLNKGRYGKERILSRPTVELMTIDHLTPKQKSGAPEFFRGHNGWGFGLEVITKRIDLAATPGRFGWMGGKGTAGYTDPQEGLITILMTQRHMDSPEPPRLFQEFETLAYQAIDD